MGGWNVVIATIAANLIGGCIFFWVDRWIFGDKKAKATADVDSDEEIIVLPSKKPADLTD